MIVVLQRRFLAISTLISVKERSRVCQAVPWTLSHIQQYRWHVLEWSESGLDNCWLSYNAMLCWTGWNPRQKATRMGRIVNRFNTEARWEGQRLAKASYHSSPVSLLKNDKGGFDWAKTIKKREQAHCGGDPSRSIADKSYPLIFLAYKNKWNNHMITLPGRFNIIILDTFWFNINLTGGLTEWGRPPWFWLLCKFIML